MTPTGDPASMTAEERMDELAALLGRALVRLSILQERERNPLEDRRNVEAPCDRPINGQRAEKEVT